MNWMARAGTFLMTSVTALAALLSTTAHAHAHIQAGTQSQTTSAESPLITTTLTRDISLNQAKAIVREKGYEPYVQGSASAWKTYTLRVLIGVKEPGDSYTNFAFFFVGNHYLGTDTAKSSARMRVAKQTDDTVTVEYTLYRPDDALADPSGGNVTVRYRWTGAKLVPLDPIPTEDWSASLSRR